MKDYIHQCYTRSHGHAIIIKKGKKFPSVNPTQNNYTFSKLDLKYI